MYVAFFFMLLLLRLGEAIPLVKREDVAQNNTVGSPAVTVDAITGYPSPTAGSRATRDNDSLISRSDSDSDAPESTDELEPTESLDPSESDDPENTSLPSDTTTDTSAESDESPTSTGDSTSPASGITESTTSISSSSTSTSSSNSDKPLNVTKVENRFTQVQLLLYGTLSFTQRVAMMDPGYNSSESEPHDGTCKSKRHPSPVHVGRRMCSTFAPGESFVVRATADGLGEQKCSLHGWTQMGCKGLKISPVGPLEMEAFESSTCIGVTNPDTGKLTEYIRSARLICEGDDGYSEGEEEKKDEKEPEEEEENAEETTPEGEEEGTEETIPEGEEGETEGEEEETEDETPADEADGSEDETTDAAD